MKNKDIKKQREILQSVIDANNKQVEYALRQRKSPFSNANLEAYRQKFKQLSLKYANDILTLNNELCAEVMYSPSLDISLAEIKKFQNNISYSRKCVLRNSELAQKMIDNFAQKLNLTPKEKEIVNVIYFQNLNYEQIYKFILYINKRTFDDHLKRIVQKLYIHIQSEKENFPQYANIYPNYPVKELEDGTYTYAQPYTTISHFLNFIM